MPGISAEEIRLKLKSFSELRDAIVAERDAASGQLPRHQWWRYHYYEFPYLIGSRSERVAERFRDVFINLSELSSDGKIGVRPDFREDDSLTQKFTHLLEEWNSRGGVPSNVLEDARAPILKYFENGDPIAVKFFEGFKSPATPFLVKYSKREFLEPMLHAGKIRISPASYYSHSKHIASVKDTETRRSFVIPTFRERLQGKTSIEFNGKEIRFYDDDLVITLNGPDYYMFCLCDYAYYRLPTDFDSDAALVIRDPDLFTQRVVSTFLAANPDWEPFAGKVTYYDPYIDYGKISIPEMSKHFGYSYQREYRIAFSATKKTKGPLQPRYITIGPMADYAELLTV